jgi:DNA methylase
MATAEASTAPPRIPHAVGLDVRPEDRIEPVERDLLDRGLLTDLAPVEAWTVRGNNHQLAYATHGVFRFFGKFPPPIAAHLLRRDTDQGDLVIDPMCGSGTTGVEALLADRRAVLGDVNPLALLLARVKTRPLDLDAFDQATVRVSGRYRPLSVDEHPFEPVGLRNAEHWFLPETAESLRGLRALIEAEERAPVRDALRVAFAGTVRRASRATTQQGRLFLDVETALPDALPTFARRAERLRVGLAALKGHSGEVSVEEMDMREAQPARQARLVVLHPPYFNSYRYSSVNSLELAWLGFRHPDIRKFEVREFFKIGKRENLTHYVEDMRGVLVNARDLTAPGGIVALMIGDTVIRGEHIPVVRTLLDDLPDDLALESIAVRVPRFTESSWVASQRRGGGAIGVRLMDFVLRFRKGGG